MNYNFEYESLINAAKFSTYNFEYTESHHIIPKCMGGTNDKSNLVNLSSKDHYIAHWLLTKMYPENSALKYALWRMTTRMHLNSVELNSKEYSKNREIFVKEKSKEMKEYFKNPENLKAHSNTMKKVYSNNKVIENCSKAQKLSYHNNPEIRERISASLKKWHSSIEAKDIQRKIKRTHPIWSEPLFSKLFDLWESFENPKCGKFKTIAIANGFPITSYQKIIDYFNCIKKNSIK
ncbi:hypothetical protein EBPHNEJP_00116 [Salmonella phage CF-SP2]|nr:hypothetical protein EBPHNEJP_00116 [Salmonella phage CF-SP2]